jgi:S1-C subfamily serine protease
MLRRAKYLRLAALPAAALAGALLAATAFTAFDDPKTVTVVRPTAAATSEAVANPSGELSVNQVYRRTRAGVVEITATSGGDSSSPFPFGDGSQQQRAGGSGFLYDDDGHIVTNQHVVAGASSITVTLSNGRRLKATLVGSDASTDLAVLKVDLPADQITPLRLGDSSSVNVGDGVVAIGSPFGLQETVTSGIVSAVDREIPSTNNFAIDNAIQTDAAINHGNSGGPLLNLRGEVIGVNAQIESESGGSDGVGFAIPSNTVRSIASRLISDGNVEHAFLGVSLQTIDADAAAALDLPRGAAVTEVRSGSAADDAGLRAATDTATVNGQEYPKGGDVITALDGKAVRSSDELRTLIDAKRPGDRVTLTFTRDGETHTATVTLGTRPA